MDIKGGTEGRPILFRLQPLVPFAGGWFRVRILIPGPSFFVVFGTKKAGDHA